MALTFSLLVRTVFGEHIYVVGDVPQLGSWIPNEGLPLSAGRYTDSNPLWYGGPVNVEAGTALEFKAVKVKEDGSVVWQPGSNQGM